MARMISSALQLAAIPILVGLIVWLELTHPFPMFRLATFILVFVLLVRLAFAAKGKARDFLIVLASTAFGLAIAEGAANVAQPEGGGLTITHGWSVRQPIMGWGPDHAGTAHAEKRDPKTNALIYKADYTIDSNLLRETHSIDHGPAIVFFGDSYTFGDGIQDNETLPQVFADSLDRKQRVLNLGFTGYSPQQFLREMETSRFDAVIGPDPKLFVFLTAPWHAERTACKAYWTPHAPHYALEDGKIVYKGDCNEGANLLLREWLENSAAYRWLIDPYRHQLNHDDVDVYVSTLEAAVKLAKDKYGVPTLIPYLRVPPEYLRKTGFTDDAIMARLRDAGAIVIDASLDAQKNAGAVISIQGDGHPTPLANRLRAEMITNYIKQNMSGVLLSGLK
ncbi:conserved membrane protein of unknown function [Methylocella tundrae]|uniref:SGNH hydrolase-type esterase domain-containing protein n=2 Tax=Methylocella tundrae TaxID=227605 RepID=A0A4U8YXF0_METTU|nr:conserved membrane protein of unknown function [Methylocella tundrae]